MYDVMVTVSLSELCQQMTIVPTIELPSMTHIVESHIMERLLVREEH